MSDIPARTSRPRSFTPPSDTDRTPEEAAALARATIIPHPGERVMGLLTSPTVAETHTGV